MIELLVVATILALLVALLLPALDKAREQARRVACQSNLHQLATAALTYASDHFQQFPYRGVRDKARNSDGNPATWAVEGIRTASYYYDDRGVWAGYIGGYTVEGASPVMWCPSNPYPVARSFGRERWPHGPAERYQSGYSFFANLYADELAGDGTPPRGDGEWLIPDRSFRGLNDAGPNAQLWTDLAEDKTTSGVGYLGGAGAWRLINHPGEDGRHEFSRTGPAGINSAHVDGSVAWYDWPDQMENAYHDRNAMPGEWWAAP